MYILFLRRLITALQLIVNNITHEPDVFIATAGQTEFNTTFDLNDNVKAYEMGARKTTFIKTGNRQITWNYPVDEFTEIIIEN
jgi:hypothetical protein